MHGEKGYNYHETMTAAQTNSPEIIYKVHVAMLVKGHIQWPKTSLMNIIPVFQVSYLSVFLFKVSHAHRHIDTLMP